MSSSVLEGNQKVTEDWMRLFTHGRKPNPQGHDLVGSCQQVTYSSPRLVYSGRSQRVWWLFFSSILFVLLSLLLIILLIQRELLSESEDDEFKSGSNRKWVSSLFNSGLSVLICRMGILIILMIITMMVMHKWGNGSESPLQSSEFQTDLKTGFVLFFNK